MARTLTSLSELKYSLPIEQAKVLSFTDEVKKIEKIKFGLSFGYFLCLVIITSTMFL